MHLGAPTLVLSGTETDGRALLRRLPEGRGWLRKDATAAEFVKMIDGVTRPMSPATLGTLGAIVLVLLVLAVILLLIYLLWLAIY